MPSGEIAARGEVWEKPSRGCVCARADPSPGQVMASAANAATTARRKSGEGIMARRLHLAVERPWRGRIEQNGLFGPSPEQLPRSNMSIPRSIGQPAKYKLDINL